MAPGTDRYRESRVERQGGEEERGKATAKSREKKRKGEVVGGGGGSKRKGLERRWESVDVAGWR